MLTPLTAWPAADVASVNCCTRAATLCPAGKASALLYTLIDSCKRNDLNPEDYLAEVIERLPEHASVEQAAELTPARIAAARRIDEGAA